MKGTLTGNQKRVKDEFIRERGDWIWSELWESIVHLDENFVEAYSALSSMPNKKGYLPAKVKEEIYIAVDVSITHMFTSGMRGHVQQALKYGASAEEILEVFEMAASFGAHTLSMGIPILVKQLVKRGENITEMELTEKQKFLKANYIDNNFGKWSETLEMILKLDEDFFEVFTNFENVPGKSGNIDSKTKELIYIALESSPTTLCEESLECHIEKALDLGVSKEEILEVFEMVSCLGVHAVAVGVPVLEEEVEKMA